MSKSQETFGKKEKEKKRLKKRKEKAEKREERKETSKGGGLANMLAYVDEHGNISDTPPDPDNKIEIELLPRSLWKLGSRTNNPGAFFCAVSLTQI